MESSILQPPASGSDPARYRILIVDDEPQWANSIKFILDLPQYDLEVATRADEALDIASRWPPQVAVLDVGLPDMNGVALSQALRRPEGGPFIIFVTGDDTNERQFACLDAGDDYITKPFKSWQLIFKVANKLRWLEDYANTAHRVDDSLPSINLEGGLIVSPSGATVKLTRVEARLMNALIEARGAVVTRAALINAVWGSDYMDTGNIIETNIRRLRRKLERDPKVPQIIRTKRRHGYWIDLDELRRRQ